jgi:hypothetical protein
MNDKNVIVILVDPENSEEKYAFLKDDNDEVIEFKSEEEAETYLNDEESPNYEFFSEYDYTIITLDK